jgi:hypothetical protein
LAVVFRVGNDAAALRFAGRYLGDMYARVGDFHWPLRTASPEFRQTLIQGGNQTDSARDLALCPPAQLHIALVEAHQRRVQIRAPGVPEPLLAIP